MRIYKFTGFVGMNDFSFLNDYVCIKRNDFNSGYSFEVKALSLRQSLILINSSIPSDIEYYLDSAYTS